MSRYPEPDEGQHGRYNDGYSPYPATNPHDRQSYTQDHFSTPYDNPLSEGYLSRGQEYQSSSNPRVRHDRDNPRAVPYRHPSSPNYHETRATSSYPLLSRPSPLETSFQPQPHQQQRHGVAYSGTSGESDTAADLNVPPLPSSNNQNPTASSHPSERPDGELGDEDASNNIRHRRTPKRVPRRYKTLKRAELFHGNFVLDLVVPTKLLDQCSHKDGREFTHMRYSAVTGDPNDFQDNGFTLRQVHYDPPRRTELFVVITTCDEDDSLFTRTMDSVMKNIAYLCKRDRSKTWGKDGWKKVVVCVVSDGREKINPRTLNVVAAIGAYQEGIAKDVVNGRPVVAHIYEYTTQISVTPSNEIEGAERGIVPMQVIFCLKEKTQNRINSHRWFFNAFGPILQPNICVLLNVGTTPGLSSIYHLWKVFDINSDVGGACGEIVVLKGKHGGKLLNPLVAAQNFEYKMAHILDKSLESVFGYITVLPGAFSAYRYIALQNNNRGEGPLQKYFLGETLHCGGADNLTASMYVAEDRILSWELVSKRGGSWLLHYVKSAYAVTDVPDQVPELIWQRRRWLNSSFLAAIHSMIKFHYIYHSSHGFVHREKPPALIRVWIHVELLYQTFNFIFSWFALGNAFISFVILTNALEDPTIIGGKKIEVTNTVLKYSYVGLLLTCFILALQVGIRPRSSNRGYTLALVGYAILTVYMIFAVIFLAVKGVQQVVTMKDRSVTFSDLLGNAIFRDVILPLSVTVGSYVAASIFHMDPWHMVTSIVQSTLLAPSYINILTVDAFANFHNVSPDTKGDNKDQMSNGKYTIDVAVPTAEADVNAAYDDVVHVLSTKQPKEEKKMDAATTQDDLYHSFWANMFMVWVLMNALLVAIILTVNGNAKTSGANHTVNGYLIFILYSVALRALVRLIGSTMYMIIRLLAGE